MRRLFLAIALAFLFSGISHADQYSIINLGTLSGGSSSANDINDSGQVVGISNNNAVLWENGSIVDLGNFGGYTTAQAINDSGQVTGFVSNISADASFFYDSLNGIQEISSPGGIGSTIARDINSSGQVVGFSHDRNGIPFSFLWQNGSMIDLGSDTFARGINDLGQIVGDEYLWENGSMTDLGTLGGSTHAQAINNMTQVVGHSVEASTSLSHAFLWENGSMTDLGTLGGSSYAFDINDLGQVVGWSDGGSGFVYDKANGMQVLNDCIPTGSGWWIHKATGINNDGQIVGYGYLEGEGQRAFLLNPEPVPEPSTLVALVGMGLMGLIGIALGRRRKT